ncbi:MAG: UbiA family prenyltransferase [Deltaproteobacteria bacterium]
MERIWVLIQASRPLGWLIAPFVFSFGLVYSGAAFSKLAVLELILLSFPYSVLLFGINDIYDSESDGINPRKKLRALPPRYRPLIAQSSLAASALLISASIATLNPSNLLGMALALFISYFYSAPPLRLKERPPLDSISNGAVFFLIFAVGHSFGKGIGEIPWKIYFVAMCVMGIHAFSTIMDSEADRAAGQRTFAVALGGRAAALFAAGTFIAALIYSDIGSAVINYYFLYCALLFAAAAFNPTQRRAGAIFKLVFAGFVATAIAFLMTYKRH